MKLKKWLIATVLSLSLTANMAFAKTITDVKGKTVEIPDQVERVVDLWHANNQVVLLLGGADKLVGTTNVIKANPWFNAVYPNIKNVPAINSQNGVQLEELLTAKPDVVLVSNKPAQEEVEKAGLKALLIGFQDFDGLKKTVRITADVLGDKAPTIAEDYIQELDTNIQLVNERLKDVPQEKRPSVIHISNGSNLFKIDGGKSIIGEWVKLAGGHNAFEDQANLVEVNIEDVLKANPDVIIVGSSNADKAVEQIKADPLWASVSAVKNGKVFVNPTGTFPWDRYSGEEALQILWAAKLFHPAQFADIDMVAKTQQFYKKYYNYELSKENAEQILKGQDPVQ
ncbi:ABC transporter substrate-binding protein [Lonepinella sp. BR2919]|uniref:ABC transporter substrate-binding protein n=1 Tax=unclassified Lonepinella TaxID=2642006 RepID=UPI003F6DCEA2